jgi:hypothetical protein
MSKQKLIDRTSTLGRATAFSLIAMTAAGGHTPAHAQKVVKGVLAGSISPGVLPVVAVFPPQNEVRVHSPDVLASTLRDPSFTGRIVIPSNAAWDMTSYVELPLHSGVTLVGERGPLGSRPLLYTPVSAFSAHPDGFTLFQVAGNDVRIEGLHLQGPAASHDTKQPTSNGISILEDADHQLGRRVVVTDNEIDHWTVSGVGLSGAHAEVALPGDYDPSWALLRPEDAGLVQIEGNYIHHNCMDSLGYGVVVGGGAYVTIEGNVFDFNRHDIAATGHAHSGYIARFNYVLEGGFQDHGSYEQHFDVHGTASTGPGHHDGGAAGEYYEIDHNTFRGDQSYGFLGHLNRPAFELRGRPAIGAYFHDNIAVHSDSDSAIRLVTGDDSSLDAGNPATFNFHADNNEYGTDHSMEVAAGDFDGDGRTDLFLATGTAWFFSRGGSQPWTYLGPSGRLTGELAFADIDNDGTTDVLWRTADGTLYYSKSGKAAPVALTHVPVPANELRFGDFDGDGKTDIFYTQGGVWNFWYSSTHAWSSPGGSSLPLSALLFGDFDGDGKTDILGVANGHWSISSAGTQPWAKLNDKLTDSFAGAVVGDFDGDGQKEIAWNDGSDWYYSPGGRGPRSLLRSGAFLDPYAPLKSLLIGHFDGGRRDDAVTFERWTVSRLFGYDVVSGNHLVIWRGPGSGTVVTTTTPQGVVRDHRGSGGDAGTGNAFVQLSAQEMR